MTVAEFYKDNKGNITRYRIYGHSGYEEKGKDIVCAAVSVLSQTALRALVEVIGICEDDIDFYIDAENAVLDVNIPSNLDEVTKSEVEIILKTLEVGIESIIEIYPKYVTLRYREV